METKSGSEVVQTRYSFYESSDPIDFSPKLKEKPSLEVVTETQSVESENSNEAHKSSKGEQLANDSRSGGDVSDPFEHEKATKNLSEVHAIEHAMINTDVSSTMGKPPMHERGISSSSSALNSATNAHETAIRDALVYIRKRGQRRMAAGAFDGEKFSGTDPLAVIASLPLSPGLDGSTALTTATKLENRLLSPPADVRKAASGMFRHQHDVDSGNGNGDVCSEVAATIKPFEGLELANSVHSLAIATGGFPLPHFSITPSSPAPGKYQDIYLNGQRGMIIDAETPEAKRQSLELERRSRREQEIENGVERVLLAILQKVDSKNINSSGEGIESALSSFFAEQALSHDIRVRPTRQDSEVEDEEDGIHVEQNEGGTFTLEKLLAEEKEAEDAYYEDSSSDDGLDTSIQPIKSKEGMQGIETVKSESSDNEETYDEIDDGSHDEMVLGPLSAESGGTTGVVLDVDGNGNSLDHEKELAHNDGSSPSIISSVTSAVRRSSDLVRQKLAFGSQKSLEDTEALVQDVYSHILVRHSSHKTPKSAASKESFSKWMSDKFTGAIDKGAKCAWDEDDPEEPGYIAHTYSRAKLQEIEQMFEYIMDREGSEYAVAMKESINDPKKSCSDFERDLVEAEQMLDEEKVEERKGIDKEVEDAETKEVSMTSPKVLQTNLNFPGAKAAGTGDVGDLEIYHLPIIYKAHQTGFEPTKDLVLQPDSVFSGQYYVQSELGSAAFSTAYRCVDLNSGKKAEDGEVYYDEVCLKVIKNTKDFFDQSLDEIKILELLRQTGKCSENNILEMKAFFYHKEHLIIVTELLRQNLFEFGKYIVDHDEPHYFTRSRLCYIARQCLVSLRFVHKLGLVHSDIKPENILLASYSRARVKVIDFGSSCYLTDRQSSYIQSRSYRAPEVLLGLPYDGKIDVWSLGCVIAEMYTGQVTFQNDSVVSMLARIEAICGAFPRHMIEEGRQSGQFFTPTGLVYEKVENDDDSAIRMDTSVSFNDEDSKGDNAIFHILQPKTTTMAARLGFDANLLRSKRKTWEEDEKALFTDFVTKLLTIDPEKRPSAEEALEHPWILSGFNLSEEDLKYPPEE